jgi:hypothetical protein
MRLGATLSQVRHADRAEMIHSAPDSFVRAAGQKKKVYYRLPRRNGNHSASRDRSRSATCGNECRGPTRLRADPYAGRDDPDGAYNDNRAVSNRPAG